MAAPAGNQFWKNRSKHGRDTLFASPTLLLEAACEYFEWCDNNPWLKSEQLKKPYQTGTGKNKTWVTIAQIPTQRPYTLSGFALFCEASEHWFKEFEKSLSKKAADPEADQKAAKDFLEVIAYVRETIATQQLEGATVGAFNASIIARKLGLSEKVESTNTNFNHQSEPLTPEKIKAIREAFKKDYL